MIDLSINGENLTTRQAAKEFRDAIGSALSNSELVVVDLSKVHLMSSGFSDELFGILWEQHGDQIFSKMKIIFPSDVGRMNFLMLLINRSISSRKTKVEPTRKQG